MKNLLSNDTKISFLRIFSGSNLKSTGLCMVTTPIQCDIQHLEKIQRSAARYVFNDYSWNSSVTNMLSNLKLPTLRLDQRCTYIKLVMAL